MAETKTLTDHDEIRDWAAARAGRPALRNAAPSIAADDAVLSLVFGQHAYQDTDEGPAEGLGLEMVEWDEWFKLFDRRKLALVVAEDVPGQRDQFHEIIRRD